MKVPYSWLAEWVHVPWEAPELGRRLTMAGFELEGLQPAAPPFTGVVVGEILAAERHPRSEKLQVCRVSMGAGAPLTIVCGAPNARAGLRCALAIVGAELPGALKIGAAQLRGVESAGMLCSARELGLAESSSGILELPADAPVGAPLREYLQLDEPVLEFAVLPNRGDAMSILGLAREVAALTGTEVTEPAIGFAGGSSEWLPVRLDAPAACPGLAGCIVRGINNRAATPSWMSERLRRAGVRSISPVVDITNYVMLELGQPMHAYDLATLKGGIRVRFAREGEAVTLLDGRTVNVGADVLLIGDEAGPVGLAGIMGGERTAVSDATTDVFFESAFFAPEAVLGRARRFGLVTEAGQRFERGVDPTGQQRALRRAVQLLGAIGAGGIAGPIEGVLSTRHQPRRAAVTLRASRLKRLLGVEFPAEQVWRTLAALGMEVEDIEGGWQATPPPWRFDLNIEADLIEEAARIVGFEAITEAPAARPQTFLALPQAAPPEGAVLEALAARGWHEAISYAFVDPALQQQLFPGVAALALANPIAADLAQMRVSLWPGLVRAALTNQSRQQERIRLFEHGARFLVQGDAAGSDRAPGSDRAAGSDRAPGGGVREVDTLAGIACGPRLPEQWGALEGRAPMDFYDVKADLEALFAATGEAGDFVFEQARLPCLHPGRTARVVRRPAGGQGGAHPAANPASGAGEAGAAVSAAAAANAGETVGYLGELHPRWVRELGFTHAPILFEIDFAALTVRVPQAREISRFPQVRRDLALVVREEVTFSALAERVILSASGLLKTLRVFDIYRGTGIEPGTKSVALGLIFQHISRTLTDEDVDRAVAGIVSDLRTHLDARIRE